MSLKDEPKFTVHAAVTIVAPYVPIVLYKPNPNLPGGREPYVPQEGSDNEICQMASEFPRKPVTERHFRQAFDQMREACLKRARDCGLVL
jgi:hypothetical protein